MTKMTKKPQPKPIKITPGCPDFTDAGEECCTSSIQTSRDNCTFFFLETFWLIEWPTASILLMPPALVDAAAAAAAVEPRFQASSAPVAEHLPYACELAHCQSHPSPTESCAIAPPWARIRQRGSGHRGLFRNSTSNLWGRGRRGRTFFFFFFF